VENEPRKPRPRLTPEELAKLPSPMDALKRETMGLPGGAPPEVVAVLGEAPRLALPERASSHWMALTSDGRLLAVPCGNNIILFETRTGTLYRTLTGHTHQAYRPAFSPDGRYLASGSGDFILRVWDVATGKEELTLKEHGQWLWSVAYDPKGKRLVSVDAGGTFKVWDAKGGLVRSFTGHAKGVGHMAFSPDGEWLATASLDGTCKLWDTDTWQVVVSLSGNGRTFEAVAWSRDASMLAAGDDDQVIVWDAGTYEVLYTLKTPGKGLIAFSPDGNTLVTARCDCKRGERHAFSRWDLKTGARQVTRELPTVGNYAFFHLSPDGQTVFVSQHDPEDTRARAYDAESGQERFPHEGQTGAVASIAFSPDGRTLATGGYDHIIRLWDLAGRKAGEAPPPMRELSGHADTVCSLAFSADGSRLVTSGISDGLFLLWDPASGRKVHDLVGPQGHWTRVAISPDGATVAVGGVDGSVNFWDARTAERKEPRRWNATAVRTVAFSPDGQLLASGDKGATVQVFEAATGRWRHAFQTGSPINNVAFSPNGQTLAAACDAPGASVHLWDLETTAERVLTGHANHILGLSFDPAGGRVATASWDGTVRLWDLTKPGQEARVFDFRDQGQAHGVAFSPEGRYLAVGLQDGTVAILRVTP
jgi:WD40 repeat protein